MIQVTATDFKTNLGKYLALVSREEIHVTKNGKDVAVLIAPAAKHSWVDNLSGIIHGAAVDPKKFKAERLARKYESLD